MEHPTPCGAVHTVITHLNVEVRRGDHGYTHGLGLRGWCGRGNVVYMYTAITHLNVEVRRGAHGYTHGLGLRGWGWSGRGSAVVFG